MTEIIYQWECTHEWARLSIVGSQLEYTCPLCNKYVTQYVNGDVDQSTVDTTDILTEWYYGGRVVAEYDDQGTVLTL